MESHPSNPAADRPSFAALILCGAVLGLAEIIVSSIMRNAGLPYRSAILTGLGMGLMALALALYQRTAAVLGVTAVATLCKALAIPVFQTPFFCNANACIAVLLNGAALAALAGIAGRRMERSAILRIAAGAGAALAGVAAFIPSASMCNPAGRCSTSTPPVACWLTCPPRAYRRLSSRACCFRRDTPRGRASANHGCRRGTGRGGWGTPSPRPSCCRAGCSTVC